MRIEDIIYQTTREVLNVEDKLRIATIFIFCDKLGNKRFSQLLYTKDIPLFIEKLNDQYSDYDVDFTINFSNPNIHSAFYKTLERVREKRDGNGFLKALFEGDEFAIVIDNIINYDYNHIKAKAMVKKISEQLRLEF